MLEFQAMNKNKTVFQAVKVLKGPKGQQGAIVVGEFIPASCVVAYANKHY